jgi:hypothetical protein
MTTSEQYDLIMAKSLKVFKEKMEDYGATWRGFRASSLTDQIYIKLIRIRNIQESGENNVGDSIKDELFGIINYSLIATIQLELKYCNFIDIDNEKGIELYMNKIKMSKDLMELKNSDYGEIWRNMKVSSIVDIMLVKILRIKTIEDNNGKTNVSEGIESNFLDIINYSIFCLILLN